MNKDKYFVVMSKFIGENHGTYTYEITFNKSLEHTGKFSGIADGLNRYDRREPWQELWLSLGRVKNLFLLGIKRLF